MRHSDCRWRNDRDEGEHATEASLSFFKRNFFEQPQQLGVVRGVGGVARRAGVERREAGGVNAGRSVQRVHFQARIIGEDESGRWKLGGSEPARKFIRFFGGIAGERVGVFDDRRRVRKIVEREKIEGRAEDGADFFGLVPVARGKDERGHGLKRKTDGADDCTRFFKIALASWWDGSYIARSF